MGTVYREGSDFRRAEECYQAALALAESTGDSKGAAITLDNIGVVRAHCGDLDGATAYFRLAAAADPGDTSSARVAAHRINLGIVLWRAGKPDEARTEWQAAYAAVAEAGDHGWKFKDSAALETEMHTSGASHFPFF